MAVFSCCSRVTVISVSQNPILAPYADRCFVTILLWETSVRRRVDPRRALHLLVERPTEQILFYTARVRESAEHTSESP